MQCQILITLDLAKNSLHMTPKAHGMKEIDKLDCIKIKNFCASKDTIKKAKRQHTNWGEIFIKSYI